jgi:Domain of unknown function (DUF1707)
MTEGSTSSEDGGQLRIGTAERTAAMKALDVHLDAGRLGVEEYGDRSAIAAGATHASELQALFTDLPEPHPALPGTTPGSPSPSTATLPVVRDEGTVERRTGNFLDVAAPRIMAVIPFVALAVFFTVGGWWWWLLIPAAGALLYGSRHGDDDRDRDREQRRRARDQRRRDR